MKLALSLVFCLGLALARVEEWSWMEMDNVDPIRRTIDDYEFQTGREFHYVYNGQMTTGIPGSSKQHSGTRIQAMVTFVFKNSNTCLMKIQNVRIGKVNRDLPNPRKVVPFEMFEEMPIDHKYKEELLLPIKFTYNGGLISNIVFDGEEQPWSINIKRGILNLLQVNIQKQGLMEDTFDKEPLTNVYRPIESEHAKFFRVMEETVEGECETLYTVTKQPNMRSYSRNVNVMNVTKSINFEKCLKRPQIKYNFRFADPCPTCESKYNDDQKFLKASTVAFYNITGTVNKFMIDSSRIESEYTFIPFSEESNVIVTYVNQTLVLVKTTPITSRVQEPRRQVQSDSDMVYTLDWDVAKETFFMEDDTTMVRKFKLPEIRNKLEIIGSLLQKLVSRMQESVQDDAPKYLDRLITLFRLCTRQEIQEIHNTFYRSNQFDHEQQKKIRDVLPHVEALCGTKACVQHLVEMISKNEIPTLTAILAVKDLINIRTPSKLIIEDLLKLAECEVVERHYALKQSVWLTIGSLMNGLCSNGHDQWARELKGKTQRLFTREMKHKTTDKLFWTRDIKENIEEYLTVKMEEKNEKFCPRHLKEKYVQLLVTKLQSTNKWEERLTFLKALGNAGLDLSIFELEKIIVNRERQYSTLIRTEAVLAMRQLKDIMPKKIQKVLMPVLMNKMENPTLRIACSYMILQTLPDLPILDQMAKMVQSERHVQVSSFVHSYMETLANSTNPCEKKLVADMRMALRHTRKINTTPFGYSKIHRVPIHSVLHKVGLDLELASSFTNMSFIPRYLTATLHSNFLGFWNKYLVSFGLVTEGLEKMMHRFSRDQNMFTDRSFEEMFDMNDYEQEFTNMFSSLNFNDEHTNEPKALLYMKFKDQDYGFLPIKRDLIRSMLTENNFNLREIQNKLRQGMMINFNKASMLHEMTYKIPTTMGLPLTVTTKIPIVMTVQGKLQVAGSEHSLKSLKINANLKPSFVATLIVDVQSWCPIVNHGLKVVHKLKVFKPIDAQVEVDLRSRTKNVRITVRPPTTRRELVSFETKPITYTRVWTKLEEPEHKIVMGEEHNRVHTFNKCIGRKMFGVEFCLRGKVHKTPSMSMVGTPFFPLSGPNKVVLTVEPGHETPQEIVINLSGKFLERTMESIRQPLFREFENLKSFDEDREDTYFRSETQQHKRSHKYNPFSFFYSEDRNTRDYEEEPSTTFHEQSTLEYTPRKPLTTTLRVDIEARPRHFTFDLVHLLDVVQGYCKINLKVASKPSSEHSQGFVACLNSESLLPRLTREVSENKVMTNARLTWGRTSCNAQNHITLKSKQIKSTFENLFESDMPEYDMFETCEDETTCQRRSQFRNEFTPEMKQLLKYHIDIDYNNVPLFVQNYTNKLFILLKHHFYEQCEVSQINVRNPEKKIRAVVTVDPITKQHINVTIRTPRENTIIRDIPTPYVLTSMKTRRTQLRNFWSNINQESVNNMYGNQREDSRRTMWENEDEESIRNVNEYSRKNFWGNDDTTTGVCQVSGRKVRTFENVEYSVPLTTCFAVLAKDCSSNPSYVVLLRKLSESTDLKEMKIKTRKHEIVLTPVSESSERVMITVNGRRINPTQDIELTESGLPVIRIIKEGSQIRVELMNKGLIVAFTGYTCTVELSQNCRSRPCGLCGQVDTDNIRESVMQYLTEEGECQEQETDCDDFTCSGKRQWGYDNLEQTFDETEPFETKYNKRQQWSNERSERNFDDSEEFETEFNGRQWGYDRPEQTFDQSEEYETEFNTPEWTHEQTEQYGNEFDRSSSTKKPTLKHKLVEQDDEVCVSLQRIPECPVNTQPERKVEKRVSFHCLNRNNRLVEKLETKVRFGQRIPEIERLTPTMTRTEVVPTKCTPLY